MNGFTLMQHLKSKGHSLPMIMITGHGDEKMAAQAMKAGVMDFLTKPFRGGELLAAIDRAMEQWESPK